MKFYSNNAARFDIGALSVAVVLAMTLCLCSATFAVQKPADSTSLPPENQQESTEVTIIVEDPRTETQPATQPTTAPATQPTTQPAEISVPKVPTAESIVTQELEKSAAPATRPAAKKDEQKKSPAPAVKPGGADLLKGGSKLSPEEEKKTGGPVLKELPVIKPAPATKPAVIADEPDFGPVVEPAPETKPAATQPAAPAAEMIEVKTVELEIAPAAEAEQENSEVDELVKILTPETKPAKKPEPKKPAEPKKVEPVKAPAPAKKTEITPAPKPAPVEPAKPKTPEPAAKPEVKTPAAPAAETPKVEKPAPAVKKPIEVKPVEVKTPATQPTTKPASTQPALNGVKIPAPKDPDPMMTKQAAADELGLTTQEMQDLIMKLQMYNSELMDELQKGRMQNYKLIRALRESRQSASDLQVKLTKKELEFQIKKLQAQQDEALKNGKEPTTLEELQRENRIMQLKLQLMAIDQPKRYAAMLEKVAELSTEKDKVWANYRKTNDLLSKQANIAEQRQEEINVIRPKLQEAEKEIARLRMEVKQLKASLTNPAPEAAAPPVVVPAKPAAPVPTETPAPKSVAMEAVESRLVGKIISIDDQIIKINIGSLKGLQTGMRLIVYRRDKFVGYMRVDIVGETTSAGSMSREILTPQVGDSVTDRL